MDRENYAARQTHTENLSRMVSFCENKTDCRRALQLSYFGENFDRQICKDCPRTVCDNCNSQVTIFNLIFVICYFSLLKITDFQVQYTQLNVTEDCVAIAEAVSSLCTKTDRWANNYTVTHFVDIFKGSQSKKVVE